MRGFFMFGKYPGQWVIILLLCIKNCTIFIFLPLISSSSRISNRNSRNQNQLPMPVAFNDALRSEYQGLFDTCSIKPEKAADVDACVNRILKGKQHYDIVSSRTNIPWYFIGIIHNMECSCDLNTHLHNGDPLTKRTSHVPKGFPKNGEPPFKWEDSAEDALRLKALDQWNDWSVPGILFQFERYNGFGYRVR